MYMYEKFIRMYPVSKTLRFELKPVGKTLENIKKNNIIKKDEDRVQAYKVVKSYIDSYHKEFIDRVLSKYSFDEGKIEKYYELLLDTDYGDEIEKIKKELRVDLIKAFKKEKDFKDLFTKEMIEHKLPNFLKEETELEEVSKFNKFTTYFTTYFENRKNMYSPEAKSTSIAYRIVDENLPMFINNIKLYNYAITLLDSENIKKINTELLPILRINDTSELFRLESFSKVLTQKQIETYNNLIGGVSLEKDVKIKGLNEYINEYRQKHPENNKIAKLNPLYKQILSDTTSISFIVDKYEKDNQVIENLKILENGFNDIKDELKDTIKQIEKFELDKIYVTNNLSITDISNKLYGDWRKITDSLNDWYDINIGNSSKIKNEQYEEKRKKYFKGIKAFSIKQLNEITSNIENHINVEQYYIDNICGTNGIVSSIEKKYNSISEIVLFEYPQNRNLKQDDDTIFKIKDYLDSIKELQSVIKTFLGVRFEEKFDKDNSFYQKMYEIWDKLLIVNVIYNKTRNYLTGKTYSMDKIKLNFNAPTLLNGWDVNKESSNKGVILRKNNLYYLVIMNKNFKGELKKSNSLRENDYEKMDYKLLPGANKMLPKVFFSKKNEDVFTPSNELLRKYNADMHKKGENFDLKFCHELIDYFKQCLEKHEDWKDFSFKFSDTSTYKDISEFYKEVENQGYKITFSGVDKDYIDSLVEEGKIFLFQIYNKDFSDKSHGRKNLHTIYWNMVFDSANLVDIVYKLNGEAEVFFRKASLPYKVTHPENMPIKNKNENNLKKESEFNYDLIKDKRYTEDKFYLHVPITMNFINKNIKNSDINEIVNREIKKNDDNYIIGIDRGERHLLYLVLIDSKGNIIEQETLNIISNEYNGNKYTTNYHELLDKKEKERGEARQTWQTIENIKELKEGFLSQAINKITDLMIKYNAIVVLEDLNFGFMRGRQKVEKQVYQKFEKMLIDKLNYLVKKNIDINECGGALKAYQLTKKFESFKKIGKQNGVLFYIPAWNTSKMDPTTGFVNLFYVKYENQEKAKEFISKFDDILFNEENNYFEFYVDYDKFTSRASGTKTNWVICTNSTRVKTFRNPQKNSEWDSIEVNLTEEFKKIFDKYNINIDKDLKQQILNVNEKDFYESFITLFKLTLQMRNSITGTEVDYIVSPVKSSNGMFYDSRIKNGKLPQNADANGAYNIARKGLWVINQIKSTDDADLRKVKLAITNKEWLNFIQNEGIEE